MKGLMQSKLSSHIAVCSGFGWKGLKKMLKCNKSWLLDIELWSCTVVCLSLSMHTNIRIRFWFSWSELRPKNLHFLTQCKVMSVLFVGRPCFVLEKMLTYSLLEVALFRREKMSFEYFQENDFKNMLKFFFFSLFFFYFDPWEIIMSLNIV